MLGLLSCPRVGWLGCRSTGHEKQSDLCVATAPKIQECGAGFVGGWTKAMQLFPGVPSAACNLNLQLECRAVAVRVAMAMRDP